MDESSLHIGQLHAWFARMNAGDRLASEELLRATSVRLERLARRMLRDFPNVRRWNDTSDVFQEAVVRLLRSLRQLDPPPATVRDFLGLAATHIRRVLLDLARQSGTLKRRGEVPLQDNSSAAGEDPRTGSEEMEQMDCWRRFHEAVEKLPMEEREVIGLRFYHGWSEQEIAELFGVTERTVRRRWTAGCARVVEVLGDDLPTP
jgi:RNA polymerase sigma factor (sigma-70 family)